MATLTNSEFDHSPLAVTLEITPNDCGDEEWIGYHLSLTSDPEPVKDVVSCRGELLRADLKVLIKELRDLISGKLSDVEFSPTDPSFLLRACPVAEEIELLWIIDQGFTERNTASTGTGVGILMTVQPRQLEEFLAELTREASMALR